MALSTRFTVSRAPHQNLNPNPTDVDDFIDLFTERRCPCADFTDERDDGLWTITLYGVKFDTSFFYSTPLCLSLILSTVTALVDILELN